MRIACRIECSQIKLGAEFKCEYNCAWTNGILFGEHILRNIEDLIKTVEKEISYQ